MRDYNKGIVSIVKEEEGRWKVRSVWIGRAGRSREVEVSMLLIALMTILLYIYIKKH